MYRAGKTYGKERTTVRMLHVRRRTQRHTQYRTGLDHTIVSRAAPGTGRDLTLLISPNEMVRTTAAVYRGYRHTTPCGSTSPTRGVRRCRTRVTTEGHRRCHVQSFCIANFPVCRENPQEGLKGSWGFIGGLHNLGVELCLTRVLYPAFHRTDTALFEP